MIKIVKFKNTEKVCDIGDVLYGNTLFSKPDNSFYGERRFFSINAISGIPWEALKVLNIDSEIFQNKLSYICPFTGYRNFWAIPLYLYSERVDDIIDNTRGLPYKSLHKDHQWQITKSFRKHLDPDEKIEQKFKLNNIQKSFMGTGYTVGTLPSDGFGKKKDCIMKLDNGDFLGGKVWVWYNR